VSPGAVRTAKRSNPGSDDWSLAFPEPDASGDRIFNLRADEASPGPTLEPLAADPWLDETEFDSLEEVDAVARSLRRVAIQYGTAILVILLLVPVLSSVAPWWFERQILGGLTLNFLVVAVALHAVFLVAALAFNRVASRSEYEMLGRLEGREDWESV
jgi:hypothetical protein